MFSRAALNLERISILKPKYLPECFGVSVRKESSQNAQIVVLKDGPERDLINFPRPKRLVYPGKVRMGFIPEEWFDFFYKKTGVTGPYMFGIGFLTYILSKEIWVLEHEFYNGISLGIMVVYIIKKYGHKFAEIADKEHQKLEDYYNNSKNSTIEFYKEGIADEEKEQWRALGQKMLFQAKRENVHLQLEAAYRERLFTVYREAKNRLDYQVEILNAQRRTEQKHMVNWIVSNVIKSISPAQEKENISKCIGDLKMLSAQ